MEFDALFKGFATFLAVKYILACLIGALLGTVIGVLPGLGPTTTMSLMLPFTVSQDATFGIIMLTGILVGSQYGGSTTSILVNIPGEAASVVTCLDGYQMAKKGRGGAALALVAVGSFIAGTVAIVGTQIFAPLLGAAALSFGPPEFLALMLLCFILLSNLSGDSPIKGSCMFALGLWLSAIGIGPLDGVARFSFGVDDLMLGIEFLPVAVGLFGISEIIITTVSPYVPPALEKIRLRNLYPNRDEVRRSVGPVARGSVLGFFVGLIPGPATVIATFVSYALEKRVSKNAGEFGKGAVEGLVGPESANNSACVGSMIPLLTLGIPFNAPSAVLLAGLLMHNVEPGPLLFQNAPQVFWTYIAALYIGNVVLLFLNLPLVGIFARVATIRPMLLMPVVSTVCLLGVYCSRNNMFDVWVMVVAGMIGVFFRVWKYPVAPLVVGLILGPMAENSFRKTLLMFHGSLLPMADRPIAMVFLLAAAAFIVAKVAFYVVRRRSAAA
ncbi:MAG: tripartite tricarboxylate transporter permease [Proteobacteria bacterium]|nr:tripartite tricarboxylate transporter permease [Pseudomonadota bacterium]